MHVGGEVIARGRQLRPLRLVLYHPDLWYHRRLTIAKLVRGRQHFFVLGGGCRSHRSVLGLSSDWRMLSSIEESLVLVLDLLGRRVLYLLQHLAAQPGATFLALLIVCRLPRRTV